MWAFLKDCFFTLIIFLAVSGIQGKNYDNKLLKVFYHHGNLGDKVVCYFSHDPLCSLIPESSAQKSSTKTELHFFIQDALIGTPEAKDMLQKLIASKDQSYHISIAEVATPARGLKIVITFNPEAIICDYTTCDLITNNKGLVFNFYHKKTLETIKSKSERVLQYAHNQFPKNRTVKVMLDFGHGGIDEGKVGCMGLKEKNITMQVGTKVAHLLRKKGYSVFLTRSADTFVPLDKRTLLANKKNVDLFVSIHANASLNANASGIETYWTPKVTLGCKETFPLGADKISIEKFMQESDRGSSVLAHSVHDNVLALVKDYGIVNRKVKKSVAQVLLGTDMPATLIELGFLSNSKEALRLSDSDYQQTLASGICKGIDTYCSIMRL